MPTNRERVRTLVSAGLLPETAQDIVENGTLGDVKDDARISALDRSRVRAFVLYSDLIPDALRGMFDPEQIDEGA